jgi:hypothetical protein
MEAPVFLLQRLLAWLSPQQRQAQLQEQAAAAEIVKRLRELQSAGTLTPAGGSVRIAPNPNMNEQLGNGKNGT